MIICMALNNMPIFSPPSLRNKTASINYCETEEPVEMEVSGHSGYLLTLHPQFQAHGLPGNKKMMHRGDWVNE